jgi:DnaJ-class molecular chaperone
MQNPYQTLGVDRDATADQIKRAYRKLASQHHPDKGGDKARFQEIQAAYDHLTNPQASAAGAGNFHTGSFDFQTIFDVFGTRFQQPQQRVQQARMSLWITLPDVARGGSRTISIGTQHGTQAAEIEIPLGINDGDSVQYPAIGPGGMDLIVTFRIHPNPEWSRQGLNLTTERTLPIWSLILGSQLELQDILQTTLSVTVVAGTQPGSLIRLRGRGLRARSGQIGDLFVRIQATIPTPVPADLLQSIQSTYGK